MASDFYAFLQTPSLFTLPIYLWNCMLLFTQHAAVLMHWIKTLLRTHAPLYQIWLMFQWMCLGVSRRWPQYLPLTADLNGDPTPELSLDWHLLLVTLGEWIRGYKSFLVLPSLCHSVFQRIIFYKLSVMHAF